MFFPISLIAQDSTLADHNIIKEHPLATNYFLQAKVAVEEEEYEKANELLIEAIIIDSLNADYYDLLAFSAAKANDIELLDDAFKQASLIYQSDHKIYFKHANAYQMLEKYHLALELYDEAIELIEKEEYFKDKHLYFFNRGNNYLKLGEYLLAKENYDQSLGIYNWHVGSYVNRGLAKFKLKDKTGACKDWGKAKSYGDENAALYLDKYCK